MTLHPNLQEVTERIRKRSADCRHAYLQGIEAAHREGPNRTRLSCGNLAHAFAASGTTDKGRLRADIAHWHVRQPAALCYWLGGQLLHASYAGGRRLA